jgi:hypothetical protein
VLPIGVKQKVLAPHRAVLKEASSSSATRATSTTCPSRSERDRVPPFETIDEMLAIALERRARNPGEGGSLDASILTAPGA